MGQSQRTCLLWELQRIHQQLPAARLQATCSTYDQYPWYLSLLGCLNQDAGHLDQLILGPEAWPVCTNDQLMTSRRFSHVSQGQQINLHDLHISSQPAQTLHIPHGRSNLMLPLQQLLHDGLSNSSCSSKYDNVHLHMYFPFSNEVLVSYS
ncbi:hypothetical protein D1872_257290 [compost metagenome]